MESSSITRRKARKNHKCDWCGLTILKGEIYEIQAIFDSGTAFSWKNHIACSELATSLNMFNYNCGEGLSHNDFCDHIVEFYVQKLEFNHFKYKLPPFNQIMDTVSKMVKISANNYLIDDLFTTDIDSFIFKTIFSQTHNSFELNLEQAVDHSNRRIRQKLGIKSYYNNFLHK